MEEALAQNVSRRILVSDCMILVWLWMRVCESGARVMSARDASGVSGRDSAQASDARRWRLGARGSMPQSELDAFRGLGVQAGALRAQKLEPRPQFGRYLSCNARERRGAGSCLYL